VDRYNNGVYLLFHLVFDVVSLIAIVEEFEKGKSRPLNEQYIRLIRMDGDSVKVVVTMNAELAKLLHRARYIVVDFTFKRVFGEMNEWEVVIWDELMRERVYSETFVT
jgi:hypothetical protein